MRLLAAVLSGLVLASLVLARAPGFREYQAVRELLQSVHPRFVPRWLSDHGYDPADFMPRRAEESESLGLELKGKWGRGRSVEVTGQDSLVFLSLGSEIAILSFSDPAQPRIVTELQLGFCPTQTYVADSLLVTGGYSCIETWSISDITHPEFRGRIPYRVGDFCVRDSFLYFVSYDDDSFRVWSVADPAAPRQLGACRDSGWATTVSGNTVVLVLHDGFGFMDVSNPRAPVRVGFYGGVSLAAKARGTMCCISNDEGGSPATASFEMLDISNPAAPYRLSKLTASGGYDIELTDTLAFVSGWQQPYGEFCIIGISDSIHPHKLSTYATPGDNWGVWASSARRRSFIADWRRGLCVLDISSLANPVLDTTMLVADQAEDIFVHGNLAYVADHGGGIRILDVSNSATPTELGGIDSAGGTCWSVVAADSFAFVGWRPAPPFRVVCINDPANPTFAGSCNAFEEARDMAIRDSFVYCAEAYRFQVINVARPLQPTLVGSCVTGDLTRAGLWLEGNAAYVAGPYDGLHIIDVTDPLAPSPLKVLSGVSAWGCCVRDSMLFVSDFDDSLHIWSVANLSNVYQLGATYVRGAGLDVQVQGDYAYVGADGLGLVDISDVQNPRLLAYYSTPDFVRRVVCDSPYVYASCWSAGVCIFDTASTAMADRSEVPVRPAEARVLGSVTKGRVTIELSTATRKEVNLQVFDVTGKSIGMADNLVLSPGITRRQLDLARAQAGVYIVRVNVGDRVYQLRITKLQ
jgi:hypothetical protein